MLFGNRMLSEDVVINIQNVNIEGVRTAKFVGVYVDDLLNWNVHVKCVKSKLSKSTAVMYRCSYLLDRNSMYILYCSMFSVFALFNILCRNVE